MYFRCIGGTNVQDDMRKLDMGTHIVVGTPGRVYDMISRKVLRTKAIKLFVLDEADEMLSRGFKDQIYDVFKLLPSDVQVILLSGIFICYFYVENALLNRQSDRFVFTINFAATMPNDVLDVSKYFMREPVRILVKKEELTLEGIKQFFVDVGQLFDA